MCPLETRLVCVSVNVQLCFGGQCKYTKICIWSMQVCSISVLQVPSLHNVSVLCSHLVCT